MLPAVTRLQRPCAAMGGAGQAVVKMYHGIPHKTVVYITGKSVIRL
ncbi:hypothetical protein ACGFX2_21200 [Streptomyces goshikiensis]